MDSTERAEKLRLARKEICRNQIMGEIYESFVGSIRLEQGKERERVCVCVYVCVRGVSVFWYQRIGNYQNHSKTKYRENLPFSNRI